jgi:hypothetical protein
MIVEKIVNASYGTLDIALRRLGFTTTSETNEFGFPFIAYSHVASGAVIYLPEKPKDELALSGEFLVVERTVDDFGVATQNAFHDLLREVDRRQSPIV